MLNTSLPLTVIVFVINVKWFTECLTVIVFVINVKWFTECKMIH